MKNRNLNTIRFRKLGIATVIAVYFLIAVGGIVRSTGSGMGCPDWPKCFGQWVPPTAESQLPENYEAVFVKQRLKKNDRLAGYLEKLGFVGLAGRLRNEPGIEEEQPFNAVKTWIEYINRLIGVIIGLLIMGTLVTSIPYVRTDKRVFYLALSAFILVVIQGWLGSVVVSTNLLPGTITVHMLLALLIVAVLINAVFLANKASLELPDQLSTSIKWIIGIAIIVSLIQVVLGTRVREAIDLVAISMNYTSRELWIGQLGSAFPIHRTYSILIVLINGFILYKLWKYKSWTILKNTSIGLALIIGLSVITGMIMAYLGFPKFAQPIHLLLGTALFGIQFLLLLVVRDKKIA